MENQDSPFSLLPEALVEDLLKNTESVSDHLLNTINEINTKKGEMRADLESSELLKRDSELPHTNAPTTCGIDGSYVVERLMATDLTATAAVAIEGLTPPSEKREWEKPHHLIFIAPEKHNPDTTMMVRGIMWELEVSLARKAPHDVVFLDGSITNPFMNLNPALNKLSDFKATSLAETLIEQFDEFLNAYEQIICTKRSDKLWVGFPKYTSKREVSNTLNWPEGLDDRAILTSILKPGEYIKPVLYDQGNTDWHLNLKALPNYKTKYQDKLENIINSINELHVCYYKPQPHTPALRLEISKSVASNSFQLSMLFNAIQFQCGTPGIFEPYPLFMADKMVKNLSKAIPAFRQTTTRDMAEKFESDLSEIFFNMHSYRTERNK